MGRRAAKKQKKEIRRAEALQAQKEEELRAERERIFRATQPAQQAATFQFGLQDRGDMGAYSDFIFSEDEDEFGAPEGTALNQDLSRLLLGGIV